MTASPTRLRPLARWFTGLALLIALPKCLLCAAAWLGLGALLGLGQPELCGAPPAINPGLLANAESVSLQPFLVDR